MILVDVRRVMLNCAKQGGSRGGESVDGGSPSQPGGAGEAGEVRKQSWCKVSTKSNPGKRGSSSRRGASVSSVKSGKQQLSSGRRTL